MTKTTRATPWYSLDAAQVSTRLETDFDSGLDADEVRRRLEQHGANEIEGDQPPGFLRLVILQFSDFMIALLIAAAVISGILGEVIDTVAIVAIVVLNAVIGVVQEFRAQRAVAALRDMSAPLATVIRASQPMRVAAAEIVPGDVVSIEAGDVVPADLRLVECTDLAIDDSALTGESVPVAKTGEVLEGDSLQIQDQRNMAFRSTLVTRGRGIGIVAETGATTAIGRIAALLRRDREARTPLQHRLEIFSRRVALAVLTICALVFVTGLMQDQPILLMFLTALSLAVAAVPEALPAVITVALGIGARRLSELNSLVRRLPAVESLGSVTYICADKTGTLTENRMSVGVVITGSHRHESLPEDGESMLLAQCLALCNDVTPGDGSYDGDPTEIALVESARLAGYDRATVEAAMPRIAELPFESERRAMITSHRTGDGILSFMKGSPERVLGACTFELSGVERIPISASHLALATTLAAEGYRVLAMASRPERGASVSLDDNDFEGGWTFLGLIGLIDPPRADAASAIGKCRNAGITPVMITGDHPATAQAIASRIGIGDDSSLCLTGNELAGLDDHEFASIVENVSVYARVDPEQKIRIVNALQARGHFVAMTGDGVNDAPALKAATIGIAMGKRGTEVAREAAEIVLLDDSFSTIVEAVREGRRIFDDIRKFVRYTMTSNSGEIWVLVLAPFLGLPLPLLPLHILWINLVTDGFPGLALSAEPAERDTMTRPPRAATEGIFTRAMTLHIFWIGLAIGALTLVTQAWSLSGGLPHWQTMVFTVLVVAQLFHSLAIRSEKDSLFSIGVTTNPALLMAVGLTVVAQLAVIYLPVLNVVFHTAPLTVIELGICFGAGSVVLLLVEIEKFFRRRWAN